MLLEQQHIKMTSTAAQVLQQIQQCSTAKAPDDVYILGRHAAPRAWHRLARLLAAHNHRPCLRRTHHTLRQRSKVAAAPSTSHPRCRLTPHTTATRFRKHAINTFLTRMFTRLPKLVDAAGLPAVELSPYDLFHGHLFLNNPLGMGLLLHCKEYPIRCEAFPHDLGFCQQGSTVAFNQQALDLRNVVWFADTLAVLNVGIGSALHSGLLMEGVEPLRTVDERVFGTPLCDVFYLGGVLVVEDFGAGRAWRD